MSFFNATKSFKSVDSQGHLLPAGWSEVLLILWLVLLPACSRQNEQLGRVTGTITLDAAPLSEAFVIFSPTSSGTTSYGKTDANGNFEMYFTDSQKGAWIGLNRVQISTMDIATGDRAAIQERVPAFYNIQTELIADVVPGKNTFQFHLKSDAESALKSSRTH